MRPTHYLIKNLETEHVSRIPFTRDNFEAMGVPYSPLAGMPELEAYQLINQWNISQHEQQRMYGLDQL